MTRPKLSAALLLCALCALFCAQEIAAHKIIEDITDDIAELKADIRHILADLRNFNANIDEKLNANSRAAEATLNANRRAAEATKRRENKFCVHIAGEHSVFDSAEGGCRCKQGFLEGDMGICVAGGQAAAAGEVESGEAEPGLGKLELQHCRTSSVPPRSFSEEVRQLLTSGADIDERGKTENYKAAVLLSLVACAAVTIWVWRFVPRRNVERVGAEGVGAIDEDTCVICFDGTKTHLVCPKPETRHLEPETRNPKPET